MVNLRVLFTEGRKLFCTPMDSSRVLHIMEGSTLPPDSKSTLDFSRFAIGAEISEDGPVKFTTLGLLDAGSSHVVAVQPIAFRDFNNRIGIAAYTIKDPVTGEDLEYTTRDILDLAALTNSDTYCVMYADRSSKVYASKPYTNKEATNLSLSVIVDHVTQLNDRLDARMFSHLRSGGADLHPDLITVSSSYTNHYRIKFLSIDVLNTDSGIWINDLDFTLADLDARIEDLITLISSFKGVTK